jgi:chromatin segregation and condensation protein Rec8/ScpA/Scc1 (kleisin family)
MFRKHHVHFELPKVKVVTIKLFHDFQGLHLERRHFEHKCHNKHALKRLKALEEIFDPSRKLEKKKFLSLVNLLLHKLEISFETCKNAKNSF